jgi:UDP-3-O-[3-hydroxymyristoyl] glucosamine N-acyltransferase
VTITVHDITDYLGDKVVGVQHTGNGRCYPITRPMPIDTATRGAITFCRQEVKYQVFVNTTLAEVILVPYGHGHFLAKENQWLIVVKDPYACFIDVCNHFFPSDTNRGIHPSAVIAPGVILGENVSIGANAVIQHATIGNNVTIQPGAVIGSDGFGFSHTNRDEDGALFRFPHYGNVIIEDDVKIGANVCIDRGTLGNTIIRKGVKIDNLVHVAHNADIGEHTALVAHSMIAGSVTIGAGSWIAPHVAIRDRQTIGKGVLAGLGAVIVTDVEDDQTVVGLPAKGITRHD